jgi:hypothetical protein
VESGGEAVRRLEPADIKAMPKKELIEQIISTAKEISTAVDHTIIFVPGEKENTE